MIRDPGLFYDPVCNMPGADFSVRSEISADYRAVPNIMIAFTAPHKITAGFPQDLANFFSYSAIMP